MGVRDGDRVATANVTTSPLREPAGQARDDGITNANVCDVVCRDDREPQSAAVERMEF
jgi:hypothetical protein